MIITYQYFQFFQKLWFSSYCFIPGDGTTTIGSRSIVVIITSRKLFYKKHVNLTKSGNLLRSVKFEIFSLKSTNME